MVHLTTETSSVVLRGRERGEREKRGKGEEDAQTREWKGKEWRVRKKS